LHILIFSRAFDSVSHTKLLARLHSYGIRGDVLKWLQNFPKDRTHQTRVGQCLSVTANLLSGVVQGSGIGPVLFLVYIDELAKLLESHGIIVKLFADDVKVYLQIVNVSDTVMLQGALDLIIVEWASTWQFPLMLNTLCMIQCYHMSLLAGTWELSLHTISLRQSTLAKLPRKHINVLVLKRFIQLVRSIT